MGTKNRLCASLAALLMGVASLALAHDPGLSTAAVKIFPDHMEAQATFARGCTSRSAITSTLVTSRHTQSRMRRTLFHGDRSEEAPR